MGGASRTSDFVRLFMAPGVGHCGGGAGPAPTGQMEALLAWVEEGRAPETFTATRNGRRRHANAAALPVSAGGAIPRNRQHRRRGEFYV